jgi:hypoxanthine phosphoribosyltransferase
MARAARDTLNLSPGAAVAPRHTIRRPHPVLPPLPAPTVELPEPTLLTPTTADSAAETKPKRKRGTRGGRRHKKAGNATATVEERPPEPESQPESKPKRKRGSRGGQRRKKAEPATSTLEERPPEPEPQPETKPKRRRGTRGGQHRKKAAKTTAAVEEPPEPEPQPEAKPKRKRGSRGGQRRKKAEPATAAAEERPPEAKPKRKRSTRSKKTASEAVPSTVAATLPLTTRRTIVPLTGAPKGDVPAPFAHPAEYEFARILDFYGIEWQYEPRSFPLRWEHGHVAEAFTPDFYLPHLNMYVEVTTLKTGLTGEKNRKMRLIKQLYPEVNIKLLKKRDYLRLLAKYGYGPPSADQVPDIDRVLITATKIQRRVGELGARISHDYAGKEPVLIGILRGVICFMSDLMRHISLPAAAVDFMAVTSYEGNGSGAVRIIKDLDENIKGRDVILVEDIVDTGMTLNHVLEYLGSKRPASLKVCALLDKRARRIANVPLEYVGFEIADEFVVGYGLDFRQRFRNLPFIALLKHELLP